ncbi:MAG: carboxypeptidase regulatory-like domain-containing protein [Candidatus Poribacteria bacterium]|nr:carboxypeptidase regulatory-like domain-containing protein [Candidatus Poribacteria bacterium]
MLCFKGCSTVGLYRLAVFCLLIAVGCGDSGTLEPASESRDFTDSDSETGAKITGRILPQKVQPLVIAYRNGNEYTTTTADETGRYEITLLHRGEYSLQVVATGFFTDISIRNLKVEPGQSVEADLVILRDRSEAATLVGQTVDKSNKLPLENAEIQVECSTGVCATLSAVSDESGRFSLDLWSGIASNIYIRKPGYVPFPRHVEALEPRQRFSLGQVMMEPVAK